MSYKKLTLPCLYLGIPLFLATNPVLSSDFFMPEETTQNNESINNESIDKILSPEQLQKMAEFEQQEKKFKKLKEGLSKSIAAEDMRGVFGQMMFPQHNGLFQARINILWTQFYERNTDPSGQTWDIKPGQKYTIDGNIEFIEQ